MVVEVDHKQEVRGVTGLGFQQKLDAQGWPVLDRNTGLGHRPSPSDGHGTSGIIEAMPTSKGAVPWAIPLGSLPPISSIPTPMGSR
jgi:hypothetical protein